jgi:hypothetical protein
MWGRNRNAQQLNEPPMYSTWHEIERALHVSHFVLAVYIIYRSDKILIKLIFLLYTIIKILNNNKTMNSKSNHEFTAAIHWLFCNGCFVRSRDSRTDFYVCQCAHVFCKECCNKLSKFFWIKLNLVASSSVMNNIFRIKKESVLSVSKILELTPEFHRT